MRRSSSAISSPDQVALPRHPQRVALDRIITNDDLQIRYRFSEPTAERYRKAMDAGTVFPPLLVAAVGQSEGLLLIDGFHRLDAMRRMFSPPSDIEVEIVGVRTMEDARWLAAKANLKHGLPLKPKELREVFRAYVRANQYLDARTRRLQSYREMATILGCGRSTLHRWMEKDFPRVFRQMGGFGGENTKGGLHDRRMEPLEQAMARQLADALKEATSAIPAMNAAARNHIRSAAHRIVEAVDAADLLEGGAGCLGEMPF
jgi:hypothetical protein